MLQLRSRKLEEDSELLESVGNNLFDFAGSKHIEFAFLRRILLLLRSVKVNSLPVYES
jgi:hypothetical protein